METNNTKIATSNQRKSPEHGTGDRLSSLPDEILSHILSFLQTKYAVGTAVLGRRWKDVWTRVSSLDLDDSLVYHHQPPNNDDDVSQNMPREQISEIQERSRSSAFSRFVDRVLSQHENLDSVMRFRLHVKSILRFKMELGSGSLLEEIDLELKPGNRRTIPESFYTLKNLKVLKLGNVVIVNKHGSLFLPRVKILQFFGVLAADCESLNRLISGSGCPVLESVHLENCHPLRWDENDKLIAWSPSLKSLRIIGRGLFPIAIEAPSLEHLHLEKYSLLQLVGSSNTELPCLDSVWLDTRYGAMDSLSELLARISNAKRIYLSRQTHDLLSVFKYAQLPIFPNLTHMTINVSGKICYLDSLLNVAPKLRSLVIDLVNWSPGKLVRPIFCVRQVSGHRPRMIWEPERACTLECLLSSLEEIVINHLEVSEHDTELVAYFFKFGAVLKKVTLQLVYGFDTLDRRGLASLLKLPRTSRVCKARLLLPDGKQIYFDGGFLVEHPVLSGVVTRTRTRTGFGLGWVGQVEGKGIKELNAARVDRFTPGEIYVDC